MHLEPILAETRRAVEARKRASHRASLEALAAAHRPRGFAATLRQKSLSGPAIIAELKKASPSKGLIRPEFDVAFLAKSLESGGAACLSVLTEEKSFQGSLLNLETASAATQIPCLRKDFIVDEFQMRIAIDEPALLFRETKMIDNLCHLGSVAIIILGLND